MQECHFPEIKLQSTFHLSRLCFPGHKCLLNA